MRNGNNVTGFIGIFVDEGATEIKHLYRGTRSETGTKFSEGFVAKGSNANMLEHIRLNPKDSKYISTSNSKQAASRYAPDPITKKGYLYEINPIQSAINVQRHLDNALNEKEMSGSQYDKHCLDCEFSVPERIEGKDIKGAWEVTEVTDQGTKKYILGDNYIQNPHYKTNIPVKVAQAARIAGRSLTAVGATIDGYNLYEAYQESQRRGTFEPFFAESARVFAAWTSAVALGIPFAEVGATVGFAAGGPIGAVIAGGAMGVVGSVTGYTGASHTVTSILQQNSLPTQQSSDQKPPQLSFISEARAEEHEEEVFFDAPEYPSESKPQAKSEKSEKKKTKPKESTSKKNLNTIRDEFTKAYAIPIEKLNDHDKAALDELFKTLENARAQQTFDETVTESKKFFAGLGSFATVIGQKDLAKTAHVGFESVNIAENLQKLGLIGTDSMISDLLSTIGSLGPHMAIISSMANIAMSFFGKAKIDPMMAMNKQYFEAILASLNIMRQEMHMRFDMLTEEIKAMLRSMDRLINKIEIILDEYFGVTLTNLVQMAEDSKADHQQLSKIISYLIKTANLKDLKTLLVYLDSKNITDDELRRITVEVPSVWLLDELVGYSFNGGIYSTQSARQNVMFVGDGIDDIGSALGFLARHAKEKSGLDLAGVYSKIDAEKLPFIQIWVPAVKAYLRTLEMEAKRKNEPIDTVHLDALLKVIDNTLNMVSVSANNAESIYKALTDQYTGSLDHLYESLVIKLEQRLKKSNKMYSFADAIKHEFITSQPLIDKFGNPLCQKILSHKQAGEPKIPVIAFLGGKVPGNKLEYTTLSLKVTEPDAQGGEKCNKGQLWVRQYSFGVQGSFVLNLNRGNISYHVTFGSLSKPVVDFTPSSSCYNKDEVKVDNVERKYVLSIRNALRVSHRKRNDTDYAAEASVTGITVGEYTQTHLNAGIAEELAAHIVTNLRAGDSLTALFGNVLAGDCFSLLQDAANDVMVDAKNADAIDGLKMKRIFSRVYGQLIGFPQEALSQLWTLMNSDAAFLMQFPSASKDMNSTMYQVIDIAKNATEHRASDIEASMTSMRSRVNKVKRNARYQKAYLENLKEWKRDVQAYRNLLDQVDAMTKADMLPKKNFMLDLDQLYLMLLYGRKLLMDVNAILTEDGYTFDSPETLDSLVSRSEEPDAVGKANITHGDNLTFSLLKAVELMEGSRNHMLLQPSQTKPACIHIGSTGDGKSEKINYICDIDFELKFDQNGQHYASPLNNATRIVNAGYGKSITKNATIVEVDGCMHVDLAGSSDDDGREADIARAFQIKMLPLVFNSIKVIDLTVTASHIYEGRFSAISRTFQEAGAIIAKNPAANAQHIVISVTKFGLSPLSKSNGTTKEHQMMIFNKLRSWHEQTIKHLDKEHEHYPINYVLEHLTADQIVIVDVLDARYRALYLERIKLSPVSNINQFNFTGIDTEAKSLDKFIEDISDQYDSNENEIYEARKTLRRHYAHEAEKMLPYQRSDISADMVDLELFEALQHEQYNLHGDIANVLNGGDITPSKMAGDPDVLAQQIAELLEEQEQTRPLLDRLTKLQEPIDVEPRLNRDSETSLPFLSIPGANAQPESEYYYRNNVPTFVANPLDALQPQLMFWRVVCHLGNKWLGVECKANQRDLKNNVQKSSFVGYQYASNKLDVNTSTILRIGEGLSSFRK